MADTTIETFGEAAEYPFGQSRSGLANPLVGQRSYFISVVGPLATYAAGASADSGSPPLRLVHSVNAAASSFNFPLWQQGLFQLLTARPILRRFLQRIWGTTKIDEALLDYAYRAAHQRGTRYAPYYLVAGYLFSLDIIRIYQSLRLPVWMADGVKGDFVDYRGTSLVENRPNWSIATFDTGTFPPFKLRDAVVNSYDAFLACNGGVTSKATTHVNEALHRH
jgi:hypothetical protein